MTLWIPTQSSSGRRSVGISGPCDGSSDCGGEIHIRDNDISNGTEIHLTVEEIKRVRKELKRLIPK